jgi:hypothetical protein
VNAGSTVCAPPPSTKLRSFAPKTFSCRNPIIVLAWQNDGEIFLPAQEFYMQAVDLLPAGDALPEQMIQRWVAAALTEAAALRDLDDQLYPATEDPVPLDRARRLHAMWEQWAEQTEGLLQRIASRGEPTQARKDVVQLRQENSWARALLGRTPRMILERLEKVREGDVVTIEEARRELRSDHCP